MGWFDGFPFKSREQMARERQEFEDRVFPLGMEQRDYALRILQELLPKKLPDEEKLFAFISSKDTYKSNKDPEKGLQLARTALLRQRHLTEEGVAAVLALVRLDDQAQSLAEYPSVEAVRKAAVWQE